MHIGNQHLFTFNMKSEQMFISVIPQAIIFSCNTTGSMKKYGAMVDVNYMLLLRLSRKCGDRLMKDSLSSSGHYSLFNFYTSSGSLHQTWHSRWHSHFFIPTFIYMLNFDCCQSINSLNTHSILFFSISHFARQVSAFIF